MKRTTLSPSEVARLLKVHKDIVFKVVPFKKMNGRYYISVKYVGELL